MYGNYVPPRRHETGTKLYPHQEAALNYSSVSREEIEAQADASRQWVLEHNAVRKRELWTLIRLSGVGVLIALGLIAACALL